MYQECLRQSGIWTSFNEELSTGTGPVNVTVTSTVSSSVSSVVIVIYSPVSGTMNNTCSPTGQIGEKLSNMYS